LPGASANQVGAPGSKENAPVSHLRGWDGLNRVYTQTHTEPMHLCKACIGNDYCSTYWQIRDLISFRATFPSLSHPARYLGWFQ
jgi:hypothetical protein